MRTSIEGTIPSTINDCKLLRLVLINSNPNLSGPLPDEFYDLVDNSLTPRDIYCIDGKTKIIIMSDIEGMGADISFISISKRKSN